MGKGGMVIAAMTASILCLCPRSLRKQGSDFGYRESHTTAAVNTTFGTWILLHIGKARTAIKRDF